MTRRRWLMASAAVAMALAATALPTGQLRHLAIPLIHDPSVSPSMAFMTVDEDEVLNRCAELSEQVLARSKVAVPGKWPIY